jgi:hypothetical protein
MKKFALLITLTALFFTGLGAIVQKASASLRSDDKALIIIKKSRRAIGGEQKIMMIKSLSIKGNRAYDVSEASKSAIEGAAEINLQLPNQYLSKYKTTRIDGKDPAENKPTTQSFNLIVTNKLDESKKLPADTSYKNDIFRTFLSLFASPPEGVSVDYKYIGDGDVDGKSCEIIEATTTDASAKLYLDKTTFLPVMMTYADKMFPSNITRMAKTENPTNPGEQKQFVVRIAEKDMKQGEARIKFSEFRDFDGLKLPFRWENSFDNTNKSKFEVTSYEINPADINERLKQPERKFLIKTN